MAAALLVIVASLCGLAAAIATLVSGTTMTASLAWQLPHAAILLRLDPLSAAFLIPIFLLGALAAIYGIAYRPSVQINVFIGLLIAGMALVVVAAHAMVFLVAWETMALAAFFLIAADEYLSRQPKADSRQPAPGSPRPAPRGEGPGVRGRSAAWIYLIATHLGTIALLALFVLMRTVRGTFELGRISGSIAMTSAMLLLAVIGFGFKAGIVPLHFWLPRAHANAPSHVSALLSGAMLKVGVYGIVRIATLLPHPPSWWGGTLIAIGATSGLIAITLALSQSDMKQALAYSSVENIGIIMIAIGLWLLARSRGDHALASLALAAAIAHVWSHSLFKGLLFFGAGSVLHATGTRRIDAMGGLWRQMPVTGNAFLIGAAAASVLPGTVAFASEALLYVGLIGSAVLGSVATFAAAIVALIGALAVACFVRLGGSIFLGSARSDAVAHAHEAPRLMQLPMIILAVACIGFGLVPSIPARALETICGGSGMAVAFLHRIELPLQALAAVAAIVFSLLILATRHAPRRMTWDCGYARPTARMQYTSRSFSEWFTARLSPRFLRPMVRSISITNLYPRTVSFAAEVDEPFGDRLMQPMAERWAARAMRLRWLQQGRLPLYLVYIFVALIAGILWSIVR